MTMAKQLLLYIALAVGSVVILEGMATILGLLLIVLIQPTPHTSMLFFNVPYICIQVVIIAFLFWCIWKTKATWPYWAGLTTGIALVYLGFGLLR